jgi:hypothetical protein
MHDSTAALRGAPRDADFPKSVDCLLFPRLNGRYRAVARTAEGRQRPVADRQIGGSLE